jgi:hypothetical protein
MTHQDQDKIEVLVETPKAHEKAILKGREELAQRVSDLQVVDQPSYKIAADTLIAVKTFIKRWTDIFKPQKDAVNAARQAILDQEKKYLGPAQLLESVLKKKMSDFEIAEEARIQAETARAQALIDKAKEKELKKLQKQLDRALDRADTDEADRIMALMGITKATSAIIAAPTISDRPGSGISSRPDIEVAMLNGREFLHFVINKTNASIDQIVTFKVGGIKNFIKAQGLDEVPGLIIKKSKIISASSRGGDDE